MEEESITRNKERFFKEAEKSDIVWLGEIHGIRENYSLYKILITKLINKGFKNLATELPTDNHPEYKDGRFSEQSEEFLEWLGILVKKGNLEKIIRFDERGSEGKNQQDSEKKLAEVLLRELPNSKTIIISGNFHSQTKKQRVSSKTYVLPAAGVVAKRTNLKILPVDLKYAGGKFYNFGIRNITPELLSFDPQAMPFGSFTMEHSNNGWDRWSIHAGIVSPVSLLN